MSTLTPKRVAASCFGALTMVSASALAIPQLDLPWPCKTSYSITQGHNTGSHTGVGAWAWDVGIGLGGEVVAPADGIIRRVKGDSTRYGCDSSYGNDGNYVVVDFGDGTEALFLHLKAGSITVTPGQQVRRGQKVGEVGNSGWICGTHLHFQLQQTCSSWYCQSIPASFIMFGDPSTGQRIESQNCAAPPASTCKIPADDALIIEETDSCFERATQWWWTEQGAGHGNSWLYTYAIDAADPDAQAWWRFEAVSAGDYELDVYIPPGAQSRQAKYLVHIGAQTHGPIQLDQTARAGWVNLGRFQLGAAQRAALHLADNTGEPYSEQDKRRVAFDAVRLRHAAPVVTPPQDMGAPAQDMDPSTQDMGSSSPHDLGMARDLGINDADMLVVPTPDLGAPGLEDMTSVERPVNIVGEGACAIVAAPKERPAPRGAGLLGVMLGLGCALRRRARRAQ